MKDIQTVKYPRSPFLILMLLGALLMINCQLTDTVVSSIKGRDSSEPLPSLEEAMALEPEDRRPTILEEMGAPDAFTIHFEELDGELVRWEAWSYFDFESSFEFMDGELLWTIEIEPAPDGSIYAHFYDPRDFQAYMSISEVQELLFEQELLEMDLTEGDIEGGLVLVGDQIMLGFDQGRLVYVETLILTPETEKLR